MADGSAARANAERAREGYAAFERGDLEAVRAMFDPNVVWHIGGRSRLARAYRGVDETFALFAELFRATGGTLKNEVHDVLATDDHVVVLLTQRAQASGKTLEVHLAHVQHLKDGKVAESWFLTDDMYAMDEFYG